MKAVNLLLLYGLIVVGLSIYDQASIRGLPEPPKAKVQEVVEACENNIFNKKPNCPAMPKFPLKQIPSKEPRVNLFDTYR